MHSYLSGWSGQQARTLTVVAQGRFAEWRDKQSRQVQQWLEASGFTAKAGKFALLPAESGEVEAVVAVIADSPDIWSLAHLPDALPEACYRIEGVEEPQQLADFALGWQLATYRFREYRDASEDRFATLLLPDEVQLEPILQQAKALCFARSLINRPANDLTPYALADEAVALAGRYQADCVVTRDEELLHNNYPLIHTVGRASDNRPCLIDLRWGDESHPRVTLVGKGICFDSGGLDIKGASNMLLMKKDMGGAASVLALADIIMGAQLPVRLRVLVAAAENSISGNAFRPCDIIRSRKGLTVEIGNTDAEGRLVLCDALAEADSESPELLIDFATLTGAARVALGTDVPAFFTPDDALAGQLASASADRYDPLWRLPLWQGYRDQLKSDVADLNNAPGGGFGGAITAALYLQEFVSQAKSWLHIDLMAWNITARPGRPKGGEAMAVRAVFAMLARRYQRKNHLETV